MAQLGPAVEVQAPRVLAPLHNLVDTAGLVAPVDDPDDRWEIGYQFRPETCETAEVWSWTCGVPKTDKGVGAASALVEVEPFTVIASSPDCQHSSDDPAAEAKRVLDATLSTAIEHEFWTGAKVAANPHLASAGATILAGGDPVGPEYALAALIQAIASCGAGGRGMIHATPMTAALWNLNLEVASGLLLSPIRGDVIVPGAGYPGTSPAGAAPPAGTAWAYATGLVSVRLGATQTLPDNDAQALDPRRNALIYRAERSAGAAWDGCCHAAVLVNLTGAPIA